MVPPLHQRWRGQKENIVVGRSSRVKISLARELRKGQTKTEEIVWWLLRSKNMLNYKFRRQHVIDGFIMDFYCPSAKLGIELDGGVHIKQKDYDIERQKIIEERGIKLLRFKNSEIYNSPEDVLKTICQYLPLSALSTKWRGGTVPACRDGGRGKK